MSSIHMHVTRVDLIFTPSIPNYNSLCFFWYIDFVMYLDIMYVYIHSKLKKVKVTRNLEQRGYMPMHIWCKI